MAMGCLPWAVLHLGEVALWAALLRGDGILEWVHRRALWGSRTGTVLRWEAHRGARGPVEAHLGWAAEVAEVAVGALMIAGAVVKTTVMIDAVVDPEKQVAIGRDLVIALVARSQEEAVGGMVEKTLARRTEAVTETEMIDVDANVIEAVNVAVRIAATVDVTVIAGVLESATDAEEVDQ